MDLTASADTASATQTHRFEFTGSGGEYFRIWIVNLLLTLITFGIYGAWAKVRRLRYFHGNTVLAGSSFEYHGEPKKILKGRLIAGALILPYYLLQNTYPLWSLLFLAAFLIALPFIIVQSRRFQMRMTSWRNIHFGFSGTYGQAAKIYLGLGALIPLTLGILFPYTQFAKQRFIIGETRFGQSKFEFSAQPGHYYAAYTAAFGWFLLSLIAWVVLLAVLVAVVGLVAGVSLSMLNNPWAILSNPSTLTITVIAGVIAYGSFIAVFLVPGAVANARITNEAFSHSSVDGHQLQSTLIAKQLVGLYLTNLFGIIFTFGLFSPWAKVRLLRYQLENTTLTVHGNLDAFIASESANVSATGEEIGDFLDVDFGL
jgi:uncharacterized membrane protein YjgN (DUF898 family)